MDDISSRRAQQPDNNARDNKFPGNGSCGGKPGKEPENGIDRE